MIRGVGASNRQIAYLVGLETSLLGMTGSLIGAGTGVLMVLVAMQHAIAIGAPFQISAVAVLIAIVGGPAVALLAAFAPVRRMLRTPLREALSSE
jgi:hypothetical protein